MGPLVPEETQEQPQGLPVMERHLEVIGDDHQPEVARALGHKGSGYGLGGVLALPPYKVHEVRRVHG